VAIAITVAALCDVAWAGAPGRVPGSWSRGHGLAGETTSPGSG